MRRVFLITVAIALVPAITQAEEVVAVMSSRLGPYQEALNGFEEAYGQPVPALDFPAGRSSAARDAKIIVAFGSRAASQVYPPQVRIITCMAPGDSTDNIARSVRIAMSPRATVILQKIRLIQPAMGRLGFLWISDNQEAFEKELREAGRAEGITILSRRLNHPDEMPDALRALQAQQVEALWIPPDPQLLTPENFNLLRAFSRSGRTPFYVANEGFVDRGATAAVAVPFAEIGKDAAQLAHALLKGTVANGNVYPDRVVFVVSEKAARDAGLDVTPAIREKLDKVMP